MLKYALREERASPSSARAVGTPILGKAMNEISVGRLFGQLLGIAQLFEMEAQPHLLLLQKTMVMVEGLATQLDPQINMWNVAAPYVREWIRDELGPEAAIADRLRKDAETLLKLPDLVRRIEEKFPPRGGAPDAPPLPEVELVWSKRSERRWPGYVLAALIGGGALWGAQALGWL